ncbi:glycosyltransferase family 4 protein [Cellulomonas shaoxiangyii]|uniref:D-inositol 3-phosphate glycosyltransferase n=1 Tax=Cellulomonas shaoxiangyii TaxID=2566013 RepID=A0A4P7SG97_9CELL|nr:glycosyltransferase family 4 protein [Cellulomonas shaoxiangyii]QCB92982.1 glycosyltransferase family 1 protein [Cellulomonas shaoxiangyii]TGY84127.1 glycosyltransferase family 1 protein [Cellulomonas shaoxiangyii]
MRVVHVSDCFAPRTGGIETQVGDLARHQVAAGHKVHVLTATLGAGGERGGVVDVEDGVHVHRLGARLPFDLPVNPVAGPRLIRAALAAVRPDAVHVHAGVLSPFAFDGARVATAAGLPTAITWHCMLDGVTGPGAAVVRRTRWAQPRAALSAVSTAAAERVRTLFDGAEVAVVPNGIDVDLWAPGATNPVRDDALRGPVRLVATMRLAPRKRAVPLVEVVAAAARRLPAGALHLTLIGDGPAREAVRARVAALGLDDVVELRGRLPREEVRAAYADADVFLAPARLEAFGIAALEARTAGLVVLAHRGTGVAEFVADGRDGFLVADDAEMARAVALLAEDRPLLASLRRHTRSVRPAFAWDHVLAAAEAEYVRAATRARGAVGP